MAMCKPVNLVVLCPNGRRQSVKMTRNCCILKVLEEVCSKQNLNPVDYDICHYNKPLDLSLPIYFANLANNALLELHPARKTRGDSLVTVGLQLESGERYTKDFMPSSTIWDIVEQCLTLKTDGSVSNEEVEPVCIYMRQKLQGDALKTTTLRSLGLTEGTAIIRLIYRKPDVLENQAHVSAPLPKSSSVEPMAVSEEEESLRPVSPACDNVKRKQPRIEYNTNITEIISNNTSNSTNFLPQEQSLDANERTFQTENSNDIVPSANKERNATSTIDENNQLIYLNDTDLSIKVEGKMSSDEGMDTEDYQMDQAATCDEIGPIHYIGERHAILYNLEDITDVKKADLPDEFFELTIADVKYLMEEYKRNRIDMENQPLLTKEQRKSKVIHNLAYYRQTVIRVYFPDKLVLQAVFDVDETVQVLYDFLRNYLEDKTLNFYLYITPPKEILNPSKTLLEALLVPAAVVYFGCEIQHPSYLMSNLRDKISDPRAASLAASESRKQSISDVPMKVDLPSCSGTTSTAQDIDDCSTTSPTNLVRTTDAKSIPKWLKLGRK